MESEEVNSENLPVEMYFKNIEEIIKEEKLDSEEEKEVQIKKEPAEINPIEFCDINMDTEEEENEYEEEMKESLEKNSSLCKEKFDAKLAEAEKGKAANSSSLLPREEYDHILNRLIELAQPEVKKTQKDYRLLRKYEILEITVEGTPVQKLKKKGTDLRFVCAEDLFDVIHAAHLANGHRGRTVLFKATGGRYANITKAQIMLYLQFCEECQLKKSSVRKSLVVKPIVSNSIISRCQVDLIDMQSQRDGEYCFILNYQDHLTKMVCLRALKTKTTEEVAYHLVDIFCDKGAPHILQSANGREFANKLIKEVLVLWPGCKLVHGKLRHLQSQGSMERANQDVETILACWQKDHNTTKWLEGLRFVQWQKNTRFHSGIGRTPYEAMFGQKPRLGVAASNLPEEVEEGLETEEQLAEALGAGIEEDPASEEEEGDGDQPEAAASPRCISCGKSYFGSHMCKDFGNPCNACAPCSVANEEVKEGNSAPVLCYFCDRKRGIQAERTRANRKQQAQAEMTAVSVRRFKPSQVGDTVMVPIPLVDRGRAEFANAKAVVVRVEENDTYKLGTKHGLLKQLYTRNQFTPCVEKFFSIEDVPQEEISLREVAIADSTRPERPLQILQEQGHMQQLI